MCETIDLKSDEEQLLWLPVCDRRKKNKKERNVIWLRDIFKIRSQQGEHAIS